MVHILSKCEDTEVDGHFSIDYGIIVRLCALLFRFVEANQEVAFDGQVYRSLDKDSEDI